MHRGEGYSLVFKEPHPSVANDILYPQPCTTKHMLNQSVKFVTGRGWAPLSGSPSSLRMKVTIKVKILRESLGV